MDLATCSDRVLTPLSNATKKLIEPLKLMPNEYLLLGVDKKAERFVAKVACLRELNDQDREEEKLPKTVLCKDGVERCISSRLLSYAARNEFFERVPERKACKDGMNKYFLAATDFTVLVIHHCWPMDRVLMGPHAKAMYALILTKFLSQNRSAEMIADFKINGVVPEMPDDFIEHPNPDLVLSDYQKVGLLASLEQSAYCLFWDAGTGKTPVAVNRINLEGIRVRRKENRMYRALIVCPKQVMYNWEKEFERFSTYPGKVSVLRGGQERRVRNLIDGTMEDETCAWAACIVSIDSVPHMWDSIKLYPWDHINYDESHYSKSPTSRRFKHFHKFSKFPHIKSRMPMTGTPIANTMMDLWAQFEMAGEGASGFINYKNFRKFHGKFKTEELAEGGQISRLVGIQNIPLIQERLARVAFMLTKDEANIQMPDKVYDFAEVDMSTRQGKIYKNLAVKLIHEIEESLGNDKRITADHVLTKLLRLAQITSGFVSWDGEVDPNTLEKTGGYIEQIDKTNTKVEYIVSEINCPERDPNGKMIIWAHFVEDLRVLSERLAELGIKHVGYHKVIAGEYRTKDAREAEVVFNSDPACRILLANPASGGTGQNFLGYDRENPDDSTMYVDREIYFSCNWSSVHRSQSEDRAVRRDARAPAVRITDLIVPDTIDEEIRERVRDKLATAMKIQDIKVLLEKLL